MDEVIMMFSGRTSRGFKKTKKVRRPAIYAPAERRIHPFKNFDVSMQGDGRFVINLSMPGVRNWGTGRLIGRTFREEQREHALLIWSIRRQQRSGSFFDRSI